MAHGLPTRGVFPLTPCTHPGEEHVPKGESPARCRPTPFPGICPQSSEDAHIPGTGWCPRCWVGCSSSRMPRQEMSARMKVAPAEGQGVPGQPACPDPWVGRGRLRGSSRMRQQARGALWPCTSLLQTAEPHGSQAASPKAAPSLPPQFSVSKRGDGQMLRAPRGHSLPRRLLSHHNPGLKTCSQQLWARICSGL